MRLGVRRAQSGVSVVPGMAAAGGAVLGSSGRLSDMVERTCAEPPGTHPREGAARGGAARPVDLDLAEVVSRLAGAQRRRHGHRGAADMPRRVWVLGTRRSHFRNPNGSIFHWCRQWFGQYGQTFLGATPRGYDGGPGRSACALPTSENSLDSTFDEGRAVAAG